MANLKPGDVINPLTLFNDFGGGSGSHYGIMEMRFRKSIEKVEMLMLMNGRGVSFCWFLAVYGYNGN